LNTKRIIALLAALIIALVSASPALADRDHRGRKLRGIKWHARGQAFCATRTLAFGSSVIITRGSCFVVSVIRERHRTFLAFLRPGVVVPAGRFVALDSRAGLVLRQRAVYLVPIITTAVLVPANTIAIVPVEVEDFDSSVVIIPLEATSPQVRVVFNIRG
jgi:hypothetical protein